MKEAESKKLLNANSYDAIVIGAGPAGTTAAYLLAKNGFKVLIIDKKSFPRDKLCGGLLTQKTVKLLEDIFQIITSRGNKFGARFIFGADGALSRTKR